MRVFRCRVNLVLFLFAIASIGGFMFVWKSTTSIPGFYQTQLDILPEASEQQGVLFERDLANLHNAIRSKQSWSARISTQRINGWLASDLPEKFPSLLPDSVDEPRVSFTDRGFHLAFRSNLFFGGVIQVTGDIFVTDRRNQIALQMNSVCSGWIPMPISVWANDVDNKLKEQNIQLEWAENEGAPVALLLLPQLETDNDDQYQFQSIRITDEAIELFGCTDLKRVSVASSQEDVSGTKEISQR